MEGTTALVHKESKRTSRGGGALATKSSAAASSLSLPMFTTFSFAMPTCEAKRNQLVCGVHVHKILELQYNVAGFVLLRLQKTFHVTINGVGSSDDLPTRPS